MTNCFKNQNYNNFFVARTTKRCLHRGQWPGNEWFSTSSNDKHWRKGKLIIQGNDSWRKSKNFFILVSGQIVQPRLWDPRRSQVTTFFVSLGGNGEFIKIFQKSFFFYSSLFNFFLFNFVPGCLRKRRQSYLGQWIRILDVVHSHVHRSWQRLAISIHCLWKWRWSVSNTLHHRPFPRWETVLLSGDDHRPILQQIFGENLVGRYDATQIKRWYLHIYISLTNPIARLILLSILLTLKHWIEHHCNNSLDWL